MFIASDSGDSTYLKVLRFSKFEKQVSIAIDRELYLYLIYSQGPSEAGLDYGVEIATLEKDSHAQNMQPLQRGIL